MRGKLLRTSLPLPASQSPQDLSVSAGEGQLSQPLPVKPSAFGRRNPRPVITHYAVGLQGDAVAGDRVLDGAERV